MTSIIITEKQNKKHLTCIIKECYDYPHKKRQCIFHSMRFGTYQKISTMLSENTNYHDLQQFSIDVKEIYQLFIKKTSKQRYYK